MQKQDPELSELITFLSTGDLPKSDKASRKILIIQDQFTIDDGVLYHFFAPNSRPTRANGERAGPAGPSAYRQGQWRAVWAGPAGPSADGQGQRRVGWTCCYARANGVRACCSVRRWPWPTAREPCLMVRSQTAGANGAPRAGPVGPSVDGQGQRHAGLACWSVRRRTGQTARGPGMLVRP